MQTHVLPRFGETRLCDIKKVDLQVHLDELAEDFSKSVVQKARTWTKAVLEEAVEQDYLSKNTARKLTMPDTQPICERFLRPEEYQRLLTEMGWRDRLILRLFVLCAFRPGELFALQWECWKHSAVEIKEAIYRGKLGKPKSPTSAAYVVLPDSLIADLRKWYEMSRNPADHEFIFPSAKETPLDSHNYLKRVLKPAAEGAGVDAVTFQALRRTFATHFHGIGTVKDQQAQTRHADVTTTLNVYTQAVPESLKPAMEAFDQKMAGILNTTEHKFKM